MAVESPYTLIGYGLPEKSLPDGNGESHALRQPGAKATLVAFVCNHCPYVRHIEQAVGEMVKTFAPQGLVTLAVVSNDLDAYPDDDVEGMKDQMSRAGWNFPYLLDRDQTVALEMGAACTPDFFLFDSDFTLTYRGAFDTSSPKNGNPVTGELLSEAITLTLEGSSVPQPHRPALGCGIKWLPGNEPEAH